MIKVIPKVFDILELLAGREQVGLKEIAAQVGLKKTTAANILRTLLDLEYMTNDGQGNYRLSKKFYELSFFKKQNDRLQSAGEAVVRELAEKINEAVVLAVLEDGERMTIAEAEFTTEGMTLKTEKRPESIYVNVTGRVLLSGLEKDALRQVIDKHGLPQGHEWPGITSLAQMQTELKTIGRKQVEYMITPSGRVQALAVPVYGPQGQIRASLGVYLPVSRFTGDRRQSIQRELKAAGIKLSGLLGNSAAE
jgi:DNA-binding IclR family transcriptional regulator